MDCVYKKRDDRNRPREVHQSQCSALIAGGSLEMRQRDDEMTRLEAWVPATDSLNDGEVCQIYDVGTRVPQTVTRRGNQMETSTQTSVLSESEYRLQGLKIYANGCGDEATMAFDGRGASGDGVSSSQAPGCSRALAATNCDPSWTSSYEDYPGIGFGFDS